MNVVCILIILNNITQITIKNIIIGFFINVKLLLIFINYFY